MSKKHKKTEWQEWKTCFKQVMQNQSQPMHQVTYWTLFIASGLTFLVGVFMGSVSASYDLIVDNPEIAPHSWIISDK